MTTTLRVIVDDILVPNPGGVARYTEELTRELIRTVPMGCEVSGVMASGSSEAFETIRRLLPGLADLSKSALPRRELQLAWQHGITKLPGTGMVHATSLLAPLSRHDRVSDPSDQTVVTIHDTVPWTHPHSLPARQSSWARAMAKRAQRYADAVVVPTHSVGEELAEIMDFGDRIRVIGGAVSSKLTIPIDSDDRARRLRLPEEYLLTTSTTAAHKGLAHLIRALASEVDAGLPLLIAGPLDQDDAALAAMVTDAGVAAHRVVPLGFLADADLAVVLDRASVFVLPSLTEGFGLPVLEAMRFGTPVVHSDAAAMVEVAADAGLTVPLEELDGYSERLARAISSVVVNPDLTRRLSVTGRDREAAFTWRDSAQKVWQLHADL